MERLTSDDFCSSSAEKTVTSSYYISLNGYTNAAVVPSSSYVADEAESERVGVFDYVLSPSQHKDNVRSSAVTIDASEDDPGGSSVHQKWAQNMNSTDTFSDSGTELTTFRCSDSDVCSQPTNDGFCITGTGDSVKVDSSNSSDLEEIVVHSQIQPQRASYERFNPDFTYPRVCCSSSVREPAAVFVTSVKPTAQSAVDSSDERDVIERRSHQYTLPCKYACLILLNIVLLSLVYYIYRVPKLVGLLIALV